MTEKVPLKLTESHRKVLDSIKQSARGNVAAVLNKLDWKDIAASRDDLVDAILAVLDTHCGAAEIEVANYYDLCREIAKGSQLPPSQSAAAKPHDVRRGRVRGAVGDAVQKIANGQTKGEFAKAVLAFVDGEINKAHFEASGSYADADGAMHGRERWARVPDDTETEKGNPVCKLCITQASLGFNYTSEETASHSHDGCRCVPVCDFGNGTEYEGYNQDEWLARYRAL